MNSKERVICALNRGGPDRVPMMDAFWEDTLTRWYAEGLPRDVPPADFFGFDIDYMALDASPRLEQRVLSEDDEFIVYQDRFGYTVKKSKGKSRTMHFLDHVTRDREAWEKVREGFALRPRDSARLDDASYFMHLDEYPTWAEALDKYNAIRRRERYLLFQCYGPYEATWRHRGFEALLIDMATDLSFVCEMAGAYMDFLLTLLQRCLDKGLKPDGIFMVEDLAYTAGMLMSPATWRKAFKPQTAKLGQFLHRHGISFWMHCCGNAEAVFDDLIECGLQVIQPLEAKSGLDVSRLSQRYGKELSFWGNIDVITMASDCESELEAEIRRKVEPFALAGGGYLYHSDHSVPPEVSFSRYLRTLELVRQYGAG